MPTLVCKRLWAEHFYHSICYCMYIYQQQRIYLTENSMLCYGPLVSEFGGPRVHGAPNPVIGGLCPRLRRLWWTCTQRQQLWCLKRRGTSLRAVRCVSCSRGGTATGRLEAGWPAQHGVGVLLQISRCCSSKQYRPASTVRERCVGGTNALTFSTTWCSHGRSGIQRVHV